jgi:hypothetical protein
MAMLEGDHALAYMVIQEHNSRPIGSRCALTLQDTTVTENSLVAQGDDASPMLSSTAHTFTIRSRPEQVCESLVGLQSCSYLVVSLCA